MVAIFFKPYVIHNGVRMVSKFFFWVTATAFFKCGYYFCFTSVSINL